jgi:hypothetical protein
VGDRSAKAPSRTPRARAQLVSVSKAEQELLCHGHAYFGGLEAFTFECPGPCSTVWDVRPRQRRHFFNAQTQRFRCLDCGIELQLSILAEILPPALSKPDAAAYEANLLSDFASGASDIVPTPDEAATMRRGGG